MKVQAHISLESLKYNQNGFDGKRFILTFLTTQFNLGSYRNIMQF